jgi:hypothetical protein
MSLVNDVLRQINEKDNSQDRMKAVLPSSLQKDSHARDKTQIILLSITALILIVYLFQSLVIGSFNKDVALVSAPNFMKVERSNVLPNRFAESVDAESVDAESVDAESVGAISKINLPDPVIKEAEQVKLEIPLDKPIRISPVPVKKVENPVRQLEQPVISKKISNSQDIQYQAALKQFIAGDVDKSERILKNILSGDIKEKYLELQARIYMKKGKSDDFYQLVKQYPENSSIGWYKLIAPGLQLFSYYYLSNQYYDALIKLEPNQIRWQLATALNYSRLGEINKAITIYSDLASSKYVSDRQKKWLAKKIKRLTLSKA